MEDEHSRKVSIKRSGLTFKCKNIYDGEIYTHHIGNVYAKVQRHSDTPLERDRKHTNIPAWGNPKMVCMDTEAAEKTFPIFATRCFIL